MGILDVLLDISDKLDKIAERLNVVAPLDCSITLYTWLDEWFTVYRAPKLRDGGYDLSHVIAKHVKTNMPNKPLNQYSAADIQKALNAVPSERMRQVARQVYNQAFREAVRCGHIDRNPVDNVDGVSHKYRSGRSLSLSEEAAFLSAAANDEDYALFRFYLLTGARPSEPLGMTWDNVGDEYLRIPGTKTVRSDRLLPISKRLRALLDELPRDRERLFPTSYQMVMRHLNGILAKLSFTFTLKDLRHTFGTRCLEAGVSMKTVQKWMGHSNYGTTANFYSHVSTDFERRELEKLDGYKPS